MLLDQEDVLELGLLKICKKNPKNKQNLKYLQMREVRGYRGWSLLCQQGGAWAVPLTFKAAMSVMRTQPCGTHLHMVTPHTQKSGLKKGLVRWLVVDRDFSWIFQCCTNELSDLCPSLSLIEHDIQINVSGKRTNYLMSLSFGKVLKSSSLPKLCCEYPGLVAWIP